MASNYVFSFPLDVLSDYIKNLDTTSLQLRRTTNPPTQILITWRPLMKLGHNNCAHIHTKLAAQIRDGSLEPVPGADDPGRQHEDEQPTDGHRCVVERVLGH